MTPFLYYLDISTIFKNKKYCDVIKYWQAIFFSLRWIIDVFYLHIQYILYTYLIYLRYVK